ncbi:MAG: RNA polymerase sigma factor [Desulfobacteraceae bacterium]|nr:MAG: RNA polymerase sigma factor [Desulfobacteraceae bacterium]
MAVRVEIRTGAEGSFLDLCDAYHDGVRRFIQTMVKDAWTADDLTQETFLRVLNKIGSLEEPSKLRAWIYSIAINLCRDHFRTRSARPREEAVRGSTELLEKLPAPCSTEAKLAGHQMNACVHRKIAMLPEGLRTVLCLFDVNGFSHSEIAQVLGISVENVKVRLHRARKGLKRILETHCTFEKDDRNVLVCEPLKHLAGDRPAD